MGQHQVRTQRVARGVFAVAIGALLLAACAPAPPAPRTPADLVRAPGAPGCSGGPGTSSMAAPTPAQGGVDASLTPAEAGDEAREAAATSVGDGELTVEDGSVPLTVTSVDEDGTPSVEQVLVADPATASDVVETLTDQTEDDGGAVLAVESDVPVQADGAPITNDPQRPLQWALNNFNFEGVWTRGNGSGVCVAVVDSGVQTDHPELSGRIVGSKDFTGEGVGAAGDHGTHVAGIIAATPDNGSMVVGAAPGVGVLNAKVLFAQGAGWDSWVAAGIIWAVDQGADVVNLSLGSSCAPSTPNFCRSTAMQAAMDHAQNNDVVVVASAGNDGNAGLWSWPAAFDWPIAVASVSADGNHSSFSTVATYVDVAAPGDSILSTVSGSGIGYASGTSMSAPYVSALVALARSIRPQETATQIRARIESTATDRGEAARDPWFGWGVVDPMRATA